MLLPETAAVIVITMDQQSFLKNLTFQYKCFLFYDIMDNNNKNHTLQYHAGNISISADILYEPQYQPMFNKTNSIICNYKKKKCINYFHMSSVFRELLVITATSKCEMFNLEFTDEAVARKCFDEFIVKDLKFTVVLNQDDADQMDVCRVIGKCLNHLINFVVFYSD